MTKIKSLRPSGVELVPGHGPTGHTHRIHRSKKGREKDLAAKKVVRRKLKDLSDKWEKKYSKYERKYE